MTTPVIHLHSFKERAMPCIPEEHLILLADAREDQSLAEYTEHLHACEACSKSLVQWKGVVDGLRQSDPIDTTRFDDAYFSQLAQQVEDRLAQDQAASPLLRVAELFRARSTLQIAAPLALAAAIVFGLLWSQAHDEAPTALVEQAVSPSATMDTVALEAEARALGRQLLRSALSDEDDGLYASLHDIAELDEFMDEGPSILFQASLGQALDSLDDDELESLFTQL